MEHIMERFLSAQLRCLC